MVASNYDDLTVRLYDRGSRSAIDDPLIGPEDALWNVLVSKDVRRVLFGSSNSTIRL